MCSLIRWVAGEGDKHRLIEKRDLRSRSVLFTMGSLEVPSYWMNAIIPAGFILLLLHFVLKFLEQLLDPSSIPGRESLEP